jgi:outer membrane protein OmpA-like peptidoglycan-associated protein
VINHTSLVYWEHWLDVLESERRAGDIMLGCLSRINQLWLSRGWNTWFEYVKFNNGLAVHVKQLRREMATNSLSSCILRLVKSMKNVSIVKCWQLWVFDLRRSKEQAFVHVNHQAKELKSLLESHRAENEKAAADRNLDHEKFTAKLRAEQDTLATAQALLEEREREVSLLRAKQAQIEVAQLVQARVDSTIGLSCPAIRVDLEAMQIYLEDTINFKRGTSDVSPEDEYICQQLCVAVSALEAAVRDCKLPPFHLRIEGHVHATGKHDREWAMSLVRAEHIADRLFDAGVSRHIIHSVPMGATVPDPKGDDSRRVELYMLTNDQYQDWMKSEEGINEMKRKRRVSMTPVDLGQAVRQAQARSSSGEVVQSGRRLNRMRRVSCSVVGSPDNKASAQKGFAALHPPGFKYY